MATATPPTDRDEADATFARLHRIDIATYEKMAECGALTPRDRVVLLDGLLVEKMTRNPPHAHATRRIFRALDAILPDGWQAMKEDPLNLPGGPDGHDSVPEPDVMLARGGPDAFADRHPGPADVGLVVEVADTTLLEDRRELARYARAGVPAAWLVNLRDGTVEVHEGPSGASGYSSTEIYRSGESVPLVLDGVRVGEVPAADLLP